MFAGADLVKTPMKSGLSLGACDDSRDGYANNRRRALVWCSPAPTPAIWAFALFLAVQFMDAAQTAYGISLDRRLKRIRSVFLHRGLWRGCRLIGAKMVRSLEGGASPLFVPTSPSFSPWLASLRTVVPGPWFQANSAFGHLS
jgi:hypothetical protein